jgi:hypothetical protein
MLFLALLLVPFAPLYSSGVILAAAALSVVTFAQRFGYYAG